MSQECCLSGRDVNVSLGNDDRRLQYLEEENKKLLYEMNLILSRKDDGSGSRDTTNIRGSTDNSDDISRMRRKLAQAEEDRDKYERLKRDL